MRPLDPTPLEPSGLHPSLLFKREDSNPTGSHKDRAAIHQLGQAVRRADRAVVISSSGNAAIATARAADLARIPAIIFVHPSTDPAKLAAISGHGNLLVVTPRAINGAKRVARDFGLPNLRASTSDDALQGYDRLAQELWESRDRFDAVVMFATSGASALAVARRLADAGPEVHFVQGEGNAALVDPTVGITDAGAHAAAAGRLGVRRSRRGAELRDAIRVTGGAGHVATTADVAGARDVLRGRGIHVSDESAANLAVAQRLVADGKRVVCVISGAPPAPAENPAPRVEATDEHVAAEIVARFLESAGGET